MDQFSGTDDFYAFIDLLGERLAAAGLSQDEQRLHCLVHKVAWTTGSKLLGELGLELNRIRDLHDSHLPADLSAAIPVVGSVP